MTVYFIYTMFCLDAESAPCPTAGNANRWAANAIVQDAKGK